MAHFAKLDKENKVIHVSVVDNVNAITEEQGIAYLQSIHGQDTIWKQTSYNGKIRKNFAGIGFTYDEKLDAFIAQKPFESWTLNEDCKWVAPVEMPKDKKIYKWDEENLSWTEIELPKK